MDSASLFFIHNYHGYILQIFIAEMLFLPLLRRRSRFLLRLLIAFLPFALLSIVLTNLLAMRVNGLASITIFLLSLGLQIAIYESKVKDILFCCVGAMLIQNLSHSGYHGNYQCITKTKISHSIGHSRVCPIIIKAL